MDEINILDCKIDFIYMRGSGSSSSWVFIAAISFFTGGILTSFLCMKGYTSLSVLSNCLKLFSSSASVTASNMAATPYSIAFVTVPNEAVGEKIAGGLVSAKLAACVNIIPGVKSIYEWEGKIESDPELILKIKTRTSRIPEVTEFVKANHPYDVCEVIATSIEGGNPQYLEWLGKIVQEK